MSTNASAAAFFKTQLTASVDDKPVGKIVGGYCDGDAIAWNHFDVKAPKPAADAGEERVPLISLHPKMSACEGLDHASLNLDEIVSCH